MVTTSTSTAVATVELVFTEPERLALAGFLAGYTGLTREAYALDLRQYASWCQQCHLRLFEARRADIECFARDLEARGRARATITRRLCTVAGFYRYGVEEELLDHSPAAHVRRPRLDYESHATGLDRNELGALLVAAGLGLPAEHELISMLALNGLRVSEATSASIEAWASSAGTGLWWSPARAARSSPSRSRRAPHGRSTWPSASAAKEQCSSPPMAVGWTGTAPGGWSAGVARRAGIVKPVGPHTLRHAFITAALDAGVSLRDVQEAASHADPRTTMRYDRARGSLDRHATYIVAAYVAGAAR
jgi:integrase/recombinase XerD